MEKKVNIIIPNNILLYYLITAPVVISEVSFSRQRDQVQRVTDEGREEGPYEPLRLINKKLRTSLRN